MHSRSLTSVLLAASFAVAAAPSEAAVVTLEGRADPAIDRAALSAAIDAAGPGGTVELLGVFQLDGEAVPIPYGLHLEGVALDDDGDGSVNEDWADGADNDADGLVDEDDWNAEIRGVLGEDGLPAPETDRSVLFNRGLVVRGLTGPVSDLTIEGIHFSGHYRAVMLEPDTGSTGGSLCGNLFPTSGLLEEPRIEGNRFSNVDRAVELEGATEDAVITDNVFEHAHGIAVIVQGGQMGCPLAGGGFSVFPVGVPVETVVTTNRFADAGIAAVFDLGAFGTEISDNLVLGGSIPLWTSDTPEVEIEGNRIEGASIAIVLEGVAPGGEVSDNEILGGQVGVYVDLGGEGYRIEDNEFAGVLFFEVVLDSGSTGNRVIVSEGDRVLDLGTGNTVTVD